MDVWISSFKLGQITINKKKYKHDVIVTWKGKVKEVELATRHLFNKKELMQLLFERPEVIVVGIGTESCLKLSAEVVAFAEENEIKIIEKPTKLAVKEFNKLARAGKKVAAFINVTC